MIQRIKKSFLGMGIFFMLSSITCFLAYNWSKLGAGGKIGVPVFLFGLSILSYYFSSENSKVESVSIFCASFFIGSSLAMFGQVYQTGADPYQLFFLWSLLMSIYTFTEKKYSLIFLQSIVTAIGIFLFVSNYESMFIAIFSVGVFFLLELFLYLYYVKVGKYKINNYFYSFLGIMIFISMLLSTFLHNIDRNFGISSRGESIFTSEMEIAVLIMVFIALYRMGRYFEKSSLEILTVALIPSLGIVVLIDQLDSYAMEKYILGIGAAIYLISLGIISFTKRYRENFVFKWIRRFILIAIFITFGGFCYILIDDKRVILILTLLLSQAIPYFSKWKFDKTEPITFLVACTTVESPANLCISFNLVYFFRNSRVLDFFYVPIHLFILSRVLTKNYTIHWFGNHNFYYIIVLSLFFFLALWERRKNFPERIIIGAKLAAIVECLLISFIRVGDTYLLSRISGVLLGMLGVFAVYSLCWNSCKRNFIILSIGVLVLGYFSLSFPPLLLGIFLFIDSMREGEYRSVRVLSITYLVSQVVWYLYVLQLGLLKLGVEFGIFGLIFIMFAILLRGGKANEKIANTSK